jgi:hypothetical protein
MDGQCDYEWLERIFNMPPPPTPPRRKVPVVAAQVAPPDLFCAETVPPPTCAGWPQTYHPWKPQVPLGYMAAAEAKREGGWMGSTVPRVAAPLEQPESPTAPIPISFLPMTVPRSSRHARPSRLSELEKLKARLDSLESTMAEMRELLDSQLRRTRARRSSSDGPGVNITNVLADGHSTLSLSDHAAVQNISLDDILRQL